MVFDPIETVTLIFAIIAFFFVALEVHKGLPSSASGKKFWTCFVLIAALILANRIFTNIEALFLGELFNLLEHLSMLGAALIFCYALWNLLRSKWKSPA